MQKCFSTLLIAGCALLGSSALTVGVASEKSFLGGWALTLPSGQPGWLGLERTNHQLQASLLWGGGSVVPLAGAQMAKDKLVLQRQHVVERTDAQGKKSKVTLTEVITATRAGDTLKLSSVKPRANGQGEETSEFVGKRVPPMPSAPKLRKVKFGPAIALLNGQDLGGWRLTEASAISGWSFKDGILSNNPAQEEGKPHKHYGNLRTEREFEDFNITLEARVGKGQNSGVYLRGLYEVQVMDSYGKPLDSHNMGAVYSRLTPSESAEKPPGEWQSLDITLVKRHVTVVLNGKKIIDNQPVLGCTGGALSSDVTRPGPIYLQGDHTGIEYRNLQLRPVLK